MFKDRSSLEYNGTVPEVDPFIGLNTYGCKIVLNQLQTFSVEEFPELFYLTDLLYEDYYLLKLQL